MRNITRTLTESDRALLPVLAKFWGVTIDKLNTPEIISALTPLYCNFFQ
jgi:hypothetical protein